MRRERFIGLGRAKFDGGVSPGAIPLQALGALAETKCGTDQSKLPASKLSQSRQTSLGKVILPKERGTAVVSPGANFVT